jgi:hypothetical protein
VAISLLRLRNRRHQLSIQQLHPEPFSLRLVVGVQRDVTEFVRHDVLGLGEQIVAERMNQSPSPNVGRLRGQIGWRQAVGSRG